MMVLMRVVFCFFSPQYVHTVFIALLSFLIFSSASLLLFSFRCLSTIANSREEDREGREEELQNKQEKLWYLQYSLLQYASKIPKRHSFNYKLFTVHNVSFIKVTLDFRPIKACSFNNTLSHILNNTSNQQTNSRTFIADSHSKEVTKDKK